MFPANATLRRTGDTWANARVVITPDRALVLVDNLNGQGVMGEAFNEEYDGTWSGPSINGWSVNLLDGTELFVVRSGGCGCGSRLRNYPGLDRVSLEPFPLG